MHADTLITGAIIITMDSGRRVLTDGALAIAGDRIVAVGKAFELARLVEAREVIDGRRFVMTPGFINGHVHVTRDALQRLHAGEFGLRRRGVEMVGAPA